MSSSPYYWLAVAAVTILFALFDLDAVSSRRVGRIHVLSIIAYAASGAVLVADWPIYRAHGPVTWLFPAAIRVASIIVLGGSRILANAVRLEHRLTHRPERRSPELRPLPQATLSEHELRAAAEYDDEWREKDIAHRHEDERHMHDQTASASPADEARFEHLVQKAIDELPADIHERMSNVAVVVEDEPPRGERFLGLYRGIPLTRRGRGYSGVLPDKITIYRGPLERLYGADPAQLGREVRRTVRHEIAHHFGISDQRLVELDRY